MQETCRFVVLWRMKSRSANFSPNPASFKEGPVCTKEVESSPMSDDDKLVSMCTNAS